MYMYMRIVITMNIYITKANQEYLNSLPDGQSKSGLINDLLDKERGATPLQVAKENFDEELDKWPKKDSGVPEEPSDIADPAPPKKNLGKDLCPHGLPWAMCKKAKCNIEGRKRGKSA